jgi:hypothetical protein
MAGETEPVAADWPRVGMTSVTMVPLVAPEHVLSQEREEAWEIRGLIGFLSRESSMVVEAITRA